MENQIENAIRKFASSVPSNSQVLDVGCGRKPYEKYFLNCKYIGIDVESSGRPKEDKIPDKYYDGENIPFNDGTIDIITCTEVLEHCVNPEQLIKEFYRVLKKEGKVFLTVPFIWGLHEEPYDFRRYSIHGIIKLCNYNKFVVAKQGRLYEGISAVEILVSSEMNNYETTKNSKDTLISKILKKATNLLWKTVLMLWRKQYLFKRIYIDNMLILEK